MFLVPVYLNQVPLYLSIVSMKQVYNENSKLGALVQGGQSQQTHFGRPVPPCTSWPWLRPPKRDLWFSFISSIRLLPEFGVKLLLVQDSRVDLKIHQNTPFQEKKPSKIFRGGAWPLLTPLPSVTWAPRFSYLQCSSVFSFPIRIFGNPVWKNGS